MIATIGSLGLSRASLAVVSDWETLFIASLASLDRYIVEVISVPAGTLRSRNRGSRSALVMGI